ncbi:hypothetical protein [Candidatus Palauibacter sp.]|uniref:hypothetical protein n=1 Tax=Candidatus Palauibacter sp. TaxID=3101350 RepID=UPI003B5BD6E2
MRRSRGLLFPGCALAVGALVTLGACTEDPLSLGSETVPGAGAETRDVTVSVSELAKWRDTTLTGFAGPSTAPFVFVSNGSEVSGRALGRFNVPDTIRTRADTLPVATFAEVELLLRIDTLRSEFGGFPLTLRMIALDQPFDTDFATWMQAGEGVPWAVPGGDLGPEIASGVFEEVSDSLFLSVALPEDSLMKAWQDRDGGNGFALVLEGPETRLRLTRMVLRYDPTLVGRLVPVPQVEQWTERTFIQDPPLPPTGSALRIGGLPASRIYFDFTPPEGLGGASLGGATISQAEVILHPLAAPELYAAERAIEATKISLLGDPFVTGAKTPIGRGDLVAKSLEPSLLESGEPVRLDITLLLARAVRDSLDSIRFGFRANPDAQVVGYWEFGSAESPVEFQPQLRVVFSSAPNFRVP